MIISGPVGATGATGPQGPAVSVGTMAAQNANNVTISGGLITNIGLLEVNQWVLTPEFGYPTGGAVPLRFDVKSLIYIGLTVDAIFTISTFKVGGVMVLLLKNTTGGTLNITWPAWVTAAGSFPATLSSGQILVAQAYCLGNDEGSVYATSSL